MHRWIKTGLFALAACLAPQAAHAQFVQVYSPPPAHVVLPVTTFYAPPVTAYYAQPVTAYYAQPVTAYYAQPVTTYYAQPYAVYAPPAIAYTPGVVTTRTYTGLGIFRPRGIYTETYVAPVVPRTTYYVPAFRR